MKKKLLFVAMLIAGALGGNLFAQAQWMNSLNDNIYISQLSLPGAHDAATGHGFSGLVGVIGGATAGKCQDLELGEQWDAGVRVFDLRPTDDGDDCTINHGSLATNMTLRTALTTINGKLSSYSSEFAIVLMRKESGGDSWASKVANVISQFSNVMPFSPNLRLGDVRGKILVLSRDYFADGYKIDYWTDNTARDVKSANGVDFVVQDYYQVEDTDAKSTAITNLLTEARTNTNTRCMFINHTSGYTGSTGTNSNINSNANTCNTLAYNTINANPGPTGIILMDYAGSSSYKGADLVSKIIAQNSSLTASEWAPPAAPGVSLTALAENRNVFVYNIEADAIFSRGMNWLTMAIADRPEGGDYAVPADRQKVQVRKDGSNIKIHWNDRDADKFFGQANNTDEGQMWTDLSNAGNRVVFTPANSSNYPNAYTLTNVQHSQKVDVLWKRGGKLTLWNGQGFHDWVFMTEEAFSSGELPKFKARKAIWDLYQELVRVNAVATYASALAEANAVYVSASATVEELRSAFRTLFLAVAESIENPVDVSYIFTHPDMSGDKTAQGWSYTDFAFSAGECEKYHATFSSSQSINDAPNGLYDVVFTGIYRQDDGQTQDAPQLVVSNGTTETSANFPNMDKLGAYWNIGGDPTGDWVNSSTGKMPKWMWSASDAQANDYAIASVENVKVKGNTLGVTFKVTGGSQWFNFQRVFITYKGSINAGLYKSLLEKIEEGNNYSNSNVPQKYVDAVAAAVSAAEGLTANSEEDELNDAVQAIIDAINAANAAPWNSNLALLSSTITLAGSEGIDVTSAQDEYDNATTNDAIIDALNVLRTARRLNAVDKQPDIFTGSAPEDGGQYYIYNVGAQRYLTGGVDYGTHAAVNFAAQIATFTKSGEGWRIHTNIRTDRDALNHNGFVDCEGDGDTWYLIEVSDGVYNISTGNSNTGATLLGYSGERRGNWWQVDTDNQGANLAINQWKLVSKEERDELLATATPENPIDATYYIHAAGFDHHLPEAQLAFPLTQWQTWFPEGKGGNNDIGGWDSDFNWECWNAGNIKFYQVLSNLPAGKYRLSVQGFYRHGNYDQAVNEYANPKTDGAILYATNGNNDTFQSYLVPITSEVNKAPGYGKSGSVGSFPDDRNETAAQFFEFGLYKNVVNDIIVTADGTLTIGIEKFENNQDSEWVVADNFRLTYLGPTSESITVTSAGYATYCSYHALDFTSTDIKAYVGTKEGESLTFTPATQVPANTGLLLVYEGGKTEDVPVIASADAVNKNCLTGVNEETTITTNDYILNVVSGKAGFYKAGDYTTLGAHKAYIPAAVGNGVKSFYIDLEDDPTGISLTPALSESEGEIYNLAGQRISKMQKGVNIVNGKKMVIGK